MDELSDKNIQLILFALKKLADTTDPKTKGYEHMLLEIHRITYKLDNHSQLTEDNGKQPILLN